MSVVSEAQAYQTINPAWVARELLIAESFTNPAWVKIGRRCWTSDLPETTEFTNEAPACVVTDAGSVISKSNNTIAMEGMIALRIFGGSRYLRDCWKTWHAIRDRLLNAGGTEITVADIDCRARWLWCVEENTPFEIRKHPATQWPELNCRLTYGLQGIQKET